MIIIDDIARSSDNNQSSSLPPRAFLQRDGGGLVVTWYINYLNDIVINAVHIDKAETHTVVLADGW